MAMRSMLAAELLRDASDSHVISFGAAASGAASSAARPKLKRPTALRLYKG